MALADEYSAVMQYRSEGLRKYKTDVARCAKGPPAHVSIPKVSFNDDLLYAKKVFGLSVGLQSPITRHVEKALRSAEGPLRILEIGPGGGELAELLTRRFRSRISDYWALDRDRSVRGPFDLVTNVDSLPSNIDLVIGSEVIEHIPADTFFDTILDPLRGKLSQSAVAIFSTPNALAPAGIARDFTHVQGYPWYDLYAVLRLAFGDVNIFRSTSLWSPSKMLLFLPRMLACAALDLDWCEQLVCVARKPNALNSAITVSPRTETVPTRARDE